MTSARDAALEVLHTADARAKAACAHTAAADWRAGALSLELAGATPPDRPARPDRPRLVDPRDVPRRRLGTLEGRRALLHALAHIELNAIDLAFDLVARFLACPDLTAEDRARLVDDWFTVGEDEARHLVMLMDRMEALGGSYGELDAHDGLWKAAERTRDDLLARLVVAPMALEARGLDVTPSMARKLTEVGDAESGALLGAIYADEIGHVATGVRWFAHVCALRGLEEEATFRAIVGSRLSGVVKPPFNEAARSQAGLRSSLYLDL